MPYLFKTLKNIPSLVRQLSSSSCHGAGQRQTCAAHAHSTVCPGTLTGVSGTGKSECSRCHSGQGRFCRACLLVRYGLRLENVHAAGETWLCPHCYEEDRPEQVLHISCCQAPVIGKHRSTFAVCGCRWQDSKLGVKHSMCHICDWDTSDKRALMKCDCSCHFEKCFHDLAGAAMTCSSN